MAKTEDASLRYTGLIGSGTLSIKPSGGIWTSTFLPSGKYASDWARWCHGDEPDWLRDPAGGWRPAYIYDILSSARVFTIDSVADAKELYDLYGQPQPDPRAYGFGGTIWNWEKMVRNFDALHLTDNGQWATRFPDDGRLSFYGWDSESTVFFRDVFSRIYEYTGPLIRSVERRDTDTAGTCALPRR